MKAQFDMANDKRPDNVATNLFKQAVESIPDIADAYCNGFGAIKKQHSKQIQAKDPRLISGSVDIDEATKSAYPQANRWDYAIGYNCKTHFVEVHPASTANVAEMLNKLSWLKSWLRDKAKELDELPKGTPQFVWVATEAGVHIPSTSKQFRKLAMNGLLPQKVLTLK